MEPPATTTSASAIETSIANTESQVPVPPAPLSDFVAMAAARHLCTYSTVENLRKYNKTDQPLAHALEDLPSTPKRRVWIDDPLQEVDDDGSQETTNGEVWESSFHLEQTLRKAKAALDVKRGPTRLLESPKKKKLHKAIKEGISATEWRADKRKAGEEEFCEDGAPGNHSDLALLLNNLSNEVDEQLLQVLQGSGSKDYEALTERTNKWAAQIKNAMDEALRLRKEFMRLSKAQFKKDRQAVSAMILVKLEWRRQEMDGFEW